MPKGPKTWVVYLLRCADDTLYCGITNDVARRQAAHDAGRAKYTRGRGPVAVIYTEPCADRAEASRREWAIKRLSRGAKLALAAGVSANPTVATPSATAQT